MRMEKAVIYRIRESGDICKLMHMFKDRLGSLRNGNEYIEQMADKFSRYGIVLCLDVDGDTAAFSAFYCNDHEGQEGYLSMIAVRSGYDGKGIGTRLLSHTEKVCREQGMSSLRLEVNKSNDPAVSFYRKNGFVYTGEQTEKTRFMTKSILEV